jgi:hypothetical protein
MILMAGIFSISFVVCCTSASGLPVRLPAHAAVMRFSITNLAPLRRSELWFAARAFGRCDEHRGCHMKAAPAAGHPFRISAVR